MLLLIGLALAILFLLFLTAAGPFIESVNPDELTSMGVVKRP